MLFQTDMPDSHLPFKPLFDTTLGFNGAVNIPESCDFRSQFDPLNITV